MTAQDRVREHNLRAVTNYVWSHDPTSRRAIERHLRLHKTSVSSLVAELVALGMLENGHAQSDGRPGRPAQVVQADRSVHAAIVIEVSAGDVDLGAWTLAATPIWRRHVDVRPAQDGAIATLRAITQQLARALRDLRADHRRIAGVVVALPGLLDTTRGAVLASEPLGWTDVDIRAAIDTTPALTGITVTLARIANLATRAEWHHHKDRQNVICLYGGRTGLGAGFVVDGKLLVGSSGRAGELLLTGATDAGSSRTHRSLGLDELLKASGSNPTRLTEMIDRLQAGGAPEAKAVSRLAEAIGERLATLIALLDPDTIILGGYLGELEPYLLPQLHENLTGLLAHRPVDSSNIVPGVCRQDAAQIGGAMLLADQALDNLRRGAPIR